MTRKLDEIQESNEISTNTRSMQQCQHIWLKISITSSSHILLEDFVDSLESGLFAYFHAYLSGKLSIYIFELCPLVVLYL
jgi:hypothetical protein